MAKDTTAAAETSEQKPATETAAGDAPAETKAAANDAQAQEDDDSVFDDGADLDDGDFQEVAKNTMTGDIRDAMLQVVRNLMKPWQQLTEMEQQGLIANIGQRATHIASQAVRIIATENRRVVCGTLDQLTIKDGIKAVIKVGKHDELRHELSDSVGQAVLIVVSGSEEYHGERAPAKADPDQRSLPVDDKPVADNAANIPQAKDPEPKADATAETTKPETAETAATSQAGNGAT